MADLALKMITICLELYHIVLGFGRFIEYIHMTEI